MTHHFHRNGKTLVLNGTFFFGVAEAKHLWVSPNGTFITMFHRDGTYRGGNHKNGYHSIGVSVKHGKMALAHRVVWEVCTGTEIPIEIDHINGDKKDNRLCNLRIVNRKENMANEVTRPKLVKNAREQLRRINSNPLLVKKAFDNLRKVRKEHPELFSKNQDKMKRKVIGTCVNTGEVREFSSLKDAALFVHSNGGSVSNCCRGREKTTHGWKFRYK